MNEHLLSRAPFSNQATQLEAQVVIVILSWPSYLKLPTGSILCGIPQITRSEPKEVFSQSRVLCLFFILQTQAVEGRPTKQMRTDPMSRIIKVTLVKELITNEKEKKNQAGRHT